MKEFWNERYSEEGYEYGEEPNAFLRSIVEKESGSGRALCIGEGEGRNAVYLASKGYKVSACDVSEAAKEKALCLAGDRGVELDYEVGNALNSGFEESAYDLVVLIFAHFPPSLRREIHQKCVKWLKPGGKVVLEGFSKSHIAYNTKDPKVGGPKNADMLFSKEELLEDFNGLTPYLLEEKEVQLDEGKYHVGLGHVIDLVAQKS